MPGHWSRNAANAAAVVLAAVLAAGCSGSSSAPTTQPSSGSSPSSTPASKPPAQLKLPKGAAAPAALRGTWVATNNHALSVTLSGRIYSVHDAAGPVQGRLSFRGSTVFMLTAICADGIGEYHWSIDSGRLTFRQVKKDPCINRSGLFLRSWRKT